MIERWYEPIITQSKIDYTMAPYKGISYMGKPVVGPNIKIPIVYAPYIPLMVVRVDTGERVFDT